MIGDISDKDEGDYERQECSSSEEIDEPKDAKCCHDMKKKSGGVPTARIEAEKLIVYEGDKCM
jgi:hypothetical protein